MPTPQEPPYRPGSEEIWAPPEDQAFDDEEHNIKVHEGKGPHILSFAEAKLFFHSEDRRQIWLCNREDNPAGPGKGHLLKEIHVSLMEFVPYVSGLTL